MVELLELLLEPLLELLLELLVEVVYPVLLWAVVEEVTSDADELEVVELE